MKHFIEEEELLIEDYYKNVTLHYEEDNMEENIKHFQDDEKDEDNDNCITHFNE